MKKKPRGSTGEVGGGKREVSLCLDDKRVPSFAQTLPRGRRSNRRRLIQNLLAGRGNFYAHAPKR